MIDPNLWHVPVVVHDHAAARIAERLGWTDHARVRGEIRLALLEGRASETRPPWTHWTTNRGGRPESGRQVFVWDETHTRCWVLARAAPRGLNVVTVLLERGAWTERTEQNRSVRVGSERQ